MPPLRASPTFARFSRTEAIKHIDFYDMLKQKLDLPVFCLPDGTVTDNLRQTFKAFLS